MSELSHLIELQKSVSQARTKGEKVMQGFWQFIVFFGFLGFLWFFLHRSTHQNAEVDKLVFIVIGAFGLIVIGILVGSDVLYFNKVYDSENDLEKRLSALAAATLGVPASTVGLRFAVRKQYYVLTIALEKKALIAEGISLESKTIGLTYHLLTTSLEEAIELLIRYKSQITLF